MVRSGYAPIGAVLGFSFAGQRESQRKVKGMKEIFVVVGVVLMVSFSIYFTGKMVKNAKHINAVKSEILLSTN
jgi:hypothetical protein